MKLSVSEVQDYIKCPVLYQIKYVNGVKEDPSINEEISQNIHRIVYLFFFRAMSKSIPKIEALKSKWENLWFQGMDPLQYMLTPKDERLEAGQKALVMIDNFYEANQLAPGMPLAIEQELGLTLGDHELTGNIEVVREIQDGPRRIIEIGLYKTGVQVPNQWNLDFDLNASFQSLAFRENYSAKEQRIMFHYLRSNRMFYTYRALDHYERLTSTVNAVARGINRGVFFPRESYLCNSCTYRRYCQVWK